jgi:hypothetical protein
MHNFVFLNESSAGEIAGDGECNSDYVKRYEVLEWDRVVVLCKDKSLEGVVNSGGVFSGDGKLLNRIEGFRGYLYILRASKQYLIAQMSTHYFTKVSYLLNVDGVVKKEIRHSNNVYKVVPTTDGSYFAFFSLGVRERQPYVEMNILNENGEIVFKDIYFAKSKYEFDYSGKKFVFDIDEPYMP